MLLEFLENKNKNLLTHAIRTLIEKKSTFHLSDQSHSFMFLHNFSYADTVGAISVFVHLNNILQTLRICQN